MSAPTLSPPCRTQQLVSLRLKTTATARYTATVPPLPLFLMAQPLPLHEYHDMTPRAQCHSCITPARNASRATSLYTSYRLRAPVSTPSGPYSSMPSAKPLQMLLSPHSPFFHCAGHRGASKSVSCFKKPYDTPTVPAHSGRAHRSLHDQLLPSL